jgi:hypothetical protein
LKGSGDIELRRIVRHASGLVSTPSADGGRPSEDSREPSASALKLFVEGAEAFEKGSGGKRGGIGPVEDARKPWRPGLDVLADDREGWRMTRRARAAVR